MKENYITIVHQTYNNTLKSFKTKFMKYVSDIDAK